LSASGHDAYLLYIAPNLLAVAGTSASSPSFAGLMSLVNQQTAARQGNANTTLYPLASGGSSYFHDITSGNNSVPGLTGFNATPGYDQASGLGSVDAAVLVNHWTDTNSAPTPGLTLTVAPGSITVAAGASGSVTAQVHATGGSSSSSIALSVSGAPFGVSAAFTLTAIAAPGGSSVLTISPAANAAIGIDPLTIKAIDGALTETFPLTLAITSAAARTHEGKVHEMEIVKQVLRVPADQRTSAVSGFGRASDLRTTREATKGFRRLTEKPKRSMPWRGGSLAALPTLAPLQVVFSPASCTIAPRVNVSLTHNYIIGPLSYDTSVSHRQAHRHTALRCAPAANAPQRGSNSNCRNRCGTRAGATVPEAGARTENARFTAGLLIATFRCAAPARCGAFADERRMVGRWPKPWTLLD
jgi:hypothetical protein